MMHTTYSKDRFRPLALSIAGFDPSGGAGVMADVKTFEAHEVYGLSVLTGNTIQNDQHFKGVEWVNQAQKEKSLLLLSKRFPVASVKLGMHHSLDDVAHSLAVCKGLFPDAHIVWDPVLAASSGFELNIQIEEIKLQHILQDISLITPNLMEVLRLSNQQFLEKAAQHLSQYTALLIKGGHFSGPESTDLLFERGMLTHSFRSKRINGNGKHGSGCVLSSAICANLAKGFSLAESIRRAKNYMQQFLNSNDTLLGFHDLKREKNIL